MSRKIAKYASALASRAKRASINHTNRLYLHKMSKEELEKHYSKYFSETSNIDCCLSINSEFDKIDNIELERYEKWLMESD